MKKLLNYFGFTLTEVLITLVVIGVLAAMTVPGLMQSTNNNEYVTKLFKYQSVMSNAINKFAADNGCIGNLAACGNFNSTGTQGARAIKAFTPIEQYLNVQKDCGINFGCFPSGFYKFINGFESTGTWDTFESNVNYAKAVLSDGASIAFHSEVAGPDGSNCTTNYSSTGLSPLAKTCAYFIIDVNGAKPPNQYGRDTYQFYVTNDGNIYPGGSLDVNFNPGCDPTYTHYGSTSGGTPGSGLGCAAIVIQDRAMNY